MLCPVTAVFLKLDSAKSSRRPGARIQHMRVIDPTAIKLITAAFDWLPAEAFLFPLSPASFRSRFDRCLLTLGLPAGSFTPGGLRGGGAVFVYHRGYSVTEIQCSMRLAHLQTLSFYLQEVAALIALGEASDEAKQRIRNACSIYPAIAETSD